MTWLFHPLGDFKKSENIFPWFFRQNQPTPHFSQYLSMTFNFFFLDCIFVSHNRNSGGFRKPNRCSFRQKLVFTKIFNSWFFWVLIQLGEMKWSMGQRKYSKYFPKCGFWRKQDRTNLTVPNCTLYLYLLHIKFTWVKIFKKSSFKKIFHTALSEFCPEKMNRTATKSALGGIPTHCTGCRAQIRTLIVLCTVLWESRFWCDTL